MSKSVLITGTSSGLGLECALAASQAGHRVYATMRDPGKSSALRAAVEASGLGLEILQLDVQDPESIKAALAEVLRREGRIDTLINNAGAGYLRNIEQANEAEINRVMDVNFMGVLRCTRAVLPHMRARKSGHIINISSVGGLVGQPFNEVYCAAKFAVEGLTESLASYVTPGFGVRFTSIQPGGITSEFANSVLKQVEATGGMLEDDYLPLLQRYIGNARARMGGDAYQSSAEAAAVVLACLEQEDPPLRLRTSAWSEDFCALKTAADPDGRKQNEATIAGALGL